MNLSTVSYSLAASSGTAEADFDRLSEILNNVKDLKFICLDVANGYSQHFVEYVRRVRAAYPTHTIIVSIALMFQCRNLGCSWAKAQGP